MLGKALIEMANDNYEIIATYFGKYYMLDLNNVKYKNLDIRDKKGYESLFNIFRPDVVIHTAGISSPDFAERNKQEAQDINVGGTENIASVCSRFDAKLIYISSNGIYDGEKAPYSEQDLAQPVNYYGRIKLECEEVIKKIEVPFAIVRPILMYGWNYPFERQNIVTLSIEKVSKGEVLYLYDDVFYNPILVNSCAEAIWRIAQNDIYDVFNIGGRDTVSIYELIRMVADIFELDSALIKPVKQGFLKDLIKRPRNTSYKTDKMEKILMIEPLPLRKGLEMMKSKLKEYVRP